MTISGAEIASIILALATFVTALGTMLIGIRNTRRIEEVHQLTNSKMTQLIEEVRTGATDKATLEERAKVAASP